MENENYNMEQQKDGNLTPDEKKSIEFRKLADEREDSSISSNDYGGSNEVRFLSQKMLNI